MPLLDDASGFAAAVSQRLRALRRELVKLRRRHWAYTLVFPAGADGDHAAAVRWVLADLAKVCAAEETTFQEDARAHALVEGRRQVFLHIMKSLRLDRDAVAQLTRLMEENDDE